MLSNTTHYLSTLPSGLWGNAKGPAGGQTKSHRQMKTRTEPSIRKGSQAPEALHKGTWRNHPQIIKVHCTFHFAVQSHVSFLTEPRTPPRRSFIPTLVQWWGNPGALCSHGMACWQVRGVIVMTSSKAPREPDLLGPSLKILEEIATENTSFRRTLWRKFMRKMETSGKVNC